MKHNYNRNNEIVLVVSTYIKYKNYEKKFSLEYYSIFR